MRGAASVLRKYCSLLCSHVNNVLSSAVSVASIGSRYFCPVSQIISKDVTGNTHNRIKQKKTKKHKNHLPVHSGALILAESFITKVSSCVQVVHMRIVLTKRGGGEGGEDQGQEEEEREREG